MAFALYSIDEAVDRKFIITKSVVNQAKPGTLIHIMDASESPNEITVSYRITATGQDYFIKFNSLQQFCKWAVYDTFIARYYTFFTPKDIQHYLKVNNRSIVNFCLPIILILLVAIWAIALLLIKNTTVGIIIGAGLSVVAAIAVFVIYRVSKYNTMVQLYGKVSSSAWGITIK